MKHLKKGIYGLLLSVAFFSASAQTVPVNEPDYNKPKLFQDLPQQLNVVIEQLQNLLNVPVGQSVNFNVSAGFNFQGQVVSSASKYEGSIKSVVIRSSNRAGATLTFSKITNTDGVVSYTGRIMSFQSGDGFQLAYQNGQYVLVKKQFYDMVNE